MIAAEDKAVWLIDFGVATIQSILGADLHKFHSSADGGVVGGNLLYSPPHDLVRDGQGDLFSLGLVAFTIFTGHYLLPTEVGDKIMEREWKWCQLQKVYHAGGCLLRVHRYEGGKCLQILRKFILDNTNDRPKSKRDKNIRAALKKSEIPTVKPMLDLINVLLMQGLKDVNIKGLDGKKLNC